MSVHRYSLESHLDGLDRGRLLVSVCAACATPDFPPRTRCPSCADSAPPRWLPSSGAGRLWSFAAFHKSYQPDFHLPTPYVVAAIELDDGVRLYGNVVGSPMSTLYVGQPVRARFEPVAAGRFHLGFVPTDRETS